MFSWSNRRKLTFALIALVFLSVVIGVPSFFFLYRAPTCSDGKQNGKEAGVDCGGSCTILCKTDTLPPLVYWTRISPVGKGFWNVLAYVENPNFESGAFETPYSFQLFDKENIIVAEERGTIAIPPRTVFGVFRGGVVTGERTPVRAIFEFTKEPVWKRFSVLPPEVSVTAKELTETESLPKLFATLTNKSLADISDVEAIAVLYDRSENVVGFSRTIIEFMRREESVESVFTWQAPFARPVTKIEVLTNSFDPRVHLSR